MTGDLKIKIIKDQATGEECVPPEVLRIMLGFGEHRKLCEECHEAWERKTARYCATGHALFEELLKQPEVEFIPYGFDG